MRVSLAHELLSLLAHVEEGDGLKCVVRWTVCTMNVTYYFDQEKRIDGSLVGEHKCDVKYRSHVSDTTFSTEVNLTQSSPWRHSLPRRTEYIVDGLYHNENETVVRGSSWMEKISWRP